MEFIRLEPCPDAGARRAAIAVTRSLARTWCSRVGRKRSAAASASGPGPLRSVHTTVASMGHLCASSVLASRLIRAVEFIRLEPCPDARARRAAIAVTNRTRIRGARAYAASAARLPPASGPGPLRSVHTTVASMGHLCGSSVVASRLIPAVEFIRLEPCPDAGARRAALAVTRAPAFSNAIHSGA